MATRRKFLFDQEQVISFCKEFKPSEETKISSLKVEEQELERRWLKLVANYEDVMTADESSEDAEFLKIATSKYKEAYRKYLSCKSKIEDMVTAKQPSKADESIRHDTTISQHGFSSLKLPPCDTPPFDGGYSKWPPFRDIFWAVFGTHPELSAGQKLFHLRSKTRGEAYQIVSKFDLVDENFQLAWDALKNRYENPRILVHQQMKQLFGIQVAQTETSKSIRQIQRGINDSLAIFKSYKINTQNWDPILVHHCSTKLPEETLRAWEDSLSNHKELPTWLQMSEFLSKRVEILETIADLRKPNVRETQGSKSQTFNTHSDTKKSYMCKRCKEDHPLRSCKYFKAMPVDERVKYAFANKYCMNCLSPTHFKSKCMSNNSCSKCGGKHHSMLHLDKGRNRNQRNESSEVNERPSSSGSQTATNSQTEINSNTSGRVQSHFSRNAGTTILPTALVHVEHSGEMFTVRALLDSGSEKSFISKRIQQMLALPVTSHSSQISGLGGTIVGSSKNKCFVRIKSRESDFMIKIEAIVVSKLAHFLPSKMANIENLPELSNLNLADPQFFKPSPIDMIIGSDYLPRINLNGVLSNIGNGLEARESRFGWYLSGPMPSSEINTFSTIVSSSDNAALHEEIKKFWEIEEVEKANSVSDDDAYCENYYQETTSRQSDGRYVVRLPFRKEFPADVFLGPSRSSALAQYYRMEKTMSKHPDLKEQYDNVLQEYIDLDHMESVTHFENAADKQSSFYLPHHAVIRPESKTTKLRVVFNASKKTNSGFSLNDVLYPGPVLQADLTKIILRWRFYKYVFTGDIQKMYRQVLVHQDDRTYQRILHRKSLTDDVKTYQLKTVTFGVNCAPFLAIRTLQQLSKDCKDKNPEAAEILEKEVYVDDVLSGGHTIEDTYKKQKQLITSLNSAAFPLKKITANHGDLLRNLAREDLLDEDFLKFDVTSTTKTLGIRWNAMSDSFYYTVEQKEISANTTMRNVLSVIARLYDPLGWLGPIVVTAKMIMQKLWEEKSDWNDIIPEHLMVMWNTFLKNLPDISHIKIPRWINYSPRQHVQLHGFCDASEKAYCGAIYVRVDNRDGKITTHLLTAKTKVAPLKSITIPKLELCGAVLLSKLMENIMEVVPENGQVYMWTDSSIVLGWLQKSPQTLKTFVANRVSKIIKQFGPSLWKHVKTEDNPADLGSRGCLPEEIIHNSLWWHGPSWLQQPKNLWPEPRTFDPTDLETKKVLNFHLEVQNDDIISRFSSLNRAIRVICYIFRFVQSCRKKSPPAMMCLTTEEITFAKNRLIAISQKRYFSNEYECLKNKRPISKKSHILTLTPFLDKNDLIRVGGRLENAGLSYEERHPVIIPEKSHFSVLLVRYTHQILLHSEHHIMLRAIRQGFYIPKLKNLIRKCIRECKTCTIYKHKFQSQLMAALPPERVTFSLPFTYTGVDFAGPFSIKSSTLRNAKLVKGYAAVFVCFSTRAVHLEVCSDLSTDAFLAAFSRFIGRRGQPKTLFSDNGRNFVGANYKLLKEHNLFLKSIDKCLIEKYSTQGLTWSFIPPYAPHMGGLWEAAVKSMKSHLKKIATNINFTFEEFSTLLVRIEAVLNSRPLSPITENPSEILPLTPGHLLRGAPLTAPPEAPVEMPIKSLSYINRWQRLKAMYHIFSQRWKSEYVTELQRRYKWKTTRNNLKENDFVIIKEDHLPPTEWKLGRITKLFYGKDNNVRVAEINTQNGIIVRPIVKLCVLPNMSTKDHTNSNETQN